MERTAGDCIEVAERITKSIICGVVPDMHVMSEGVVDALQPAND